MSGREELTPAGPMSPFMQRFTTWNITHVDGIPYWEAPTPPRSHACQTQTEGWKELHVIQRCACGAMRTDSNRQGDWHGGTYKRTSGVEPSANKAGLMWAITVALLAAAVIFLFAAALSSADTARSLTCIGLSVTASVAAWIVGRRALRAMDAEILA